MNTKANRRQFTWSRVVNLVVLCIPTLLMCGMVLGFYHSDEVHVKHSLILDSGVKESTVDYPLTQLPRPAAILLAKEPNDILLLHKVTIVAGVFPVRVCDLKDGVYQSHVINGRYILVIPEGYGLYDTMILPIWEKCQ